MGMDTRDFSRLSAAEYKKKTQMHWGADPCGSNYSDKGFLSREYFEEIERHRYRTHPWIAEAIAGFGLEGKDVLEIGYGMGTDHLAMAERGARVYGVDLTPANALVTGRRFELWGLPSRLAVGDAERLPFPDESFDFVYSFGVIHHSPDTPAIVSEIHRVLRPGGRCWVTVYHRNSVFFWWSVYLVDYLLRGGWRKRTLERQLSLIEYPNTSEDMVIRLYRRREFARLFGSFAGVSCTVRHLLPTDISCFSRLFRDPCRPLPWLDRIGRRLGWYVIVEAVKET